MTGVKGDFAALRRMQEHLAAVGRGDLRREINAHCAAIADMELTYQFARGHGPDGKPWAPRAFGGQPLQGFRRYITTTPTPRGFRIDARHKGAATQQYGATITAKTRRGAQGWLTFRTPTGWARKKSVTIPARQYAPEFALPASWVRQFGDAAALLLQHRLAPR